MKTRSLVMILGGIILIIFGFSNFAAAMDYPTRPIQIIDPFGAGSSTTMNARIIAQSFSQILERAVVVVNKPGAGGAVGTAFVAKAKPDGYTLLVFNSASNGISVTLRPDIGYTNSDFQLIGQYAADDCAMVVKADAPWKTVQDVIEYTRKNPGVLKYIASAGGSNRFAMELFLREAGGLKMERIPSEGGGELAQLLLGGHGHISFSPAAGQYPLVQAGKARFLAFANEERNTDFPDVPTLKELGLPGVIIQTWYGLATPKGVPEPIMEKLRETLATTMKDKTVRVMLKNMNNTPVYRTAEEFSRFVKHMEELYIRVAKEADIKLK